MKFKTLPLILVAASLLLLGNRDKPTNIVTITLNVDTENITRENLDETCDFGQDPSISNRDYTVEVGIGDDIFWNGVSTSNPDEDAVEVKMIKFENGTNLFDKNRLPDRNTSPGRVLGTVSRGRAGAVEKYSIEFKVFRGDQLRGTFEIDPKLKVKG